MDGAEQGGRQGWPLNCGGESLPRRSCQPPVLQIHYEGATMIWDQTTIQLQEYSRGIHLITNEVLSNGPELVNCQVGLLHLFIQHTSASLAINENADPDVRGDVERHLNVMVPENAAHY